VVETAAGKVRGFGSRGVAVFRGIPYGASTTGANRFMPPVKPESWPGVRNCLSYGHSCPDGGTGAIGNDSCARNTDEDAFLLYRTNGWIKGEDCLRLNVWTPSTASGRKRPVMLYMHGGGYAGGSGNDLLAYDGENLARGRFLPFACSLRFVKQETKARVLPIHGDRPGAARPGLPCMVRSRAGSLLAAIDAR
jgi:para-nitrobenzyl esterase